MSSSDPSPSSAGQPAGSSEPNGLGPWIFRLGVVAVCVLVGALVWHGTRERTPRGPGLNHETYTLEPPATTRATTTRSATDRRATFVGYRHEQLSPNTFRAISLARTEDGHLIARTVREYTLATSRPSHEWPAANPSPRTIDLLAPLDVDAAAVHGTWTREADGTIVSDADRLTRIDLGYSPPAEYDLSFHFTRREGNDGLDTVICGGGRQFYWTFAGWENTTSGFGTILGQTAESNATTSKRASWLSNGVEYACVIKVRRDGVRVYLDDELVGDHPTDYRDMNLIDRQMNRPDSIGFSTWESRYAIRDVRVTEIAGTGRRTQHQTTQAWTQEITQRYSTIAAAVDFSVAGREAQIYFLHDDGTAVGVDDTGVWSVAGNHIAFRWGRFVDTCTLAADGRSFEGRNQVGDAIRGTLRAGSF